MQTRRFLCCAGISFNPLTTMNVFASRFPSTSLSLLAALLIAPFAQAALVGPAPYVKPADSPFAGGSYSYFYLEDFEDHALNTPGVSASVGGPTSIAFGAGSHDSVDADDGVIDGASLLGDSYFYGTGSIGITFSFDEVLLGALPTGVGIVWTDGDGAVTFEAFDAMGISLGTLTSTTADGSYEGGTAEDRFFGATAAGGISKIFISNAGGGIEVDHLQYGLASRTPHQVPDALNLGGTMALVLALLAFGRRVVARRT